MDPNFLDINQLKEETYRYRDYIIDEEEKSGKSDSLHILEAIKTAYAKEISSIIVTNIKFRESRVFYMLRIGETKIDLTEQNHSFRNNISFNLITEEISLNLKKMPPLFKRSFQQRIKEIIHDIETLSAGVYEEKTV